MAGERVVVGMSGGVDSSVAALLLKRRGFDVVGLFMKNWEEEDDEYCSTRQDLVDCASVAEVIGIELEAVNFSAQYKERVFGAFLAEYSAGRTPNPDVLCNAEIKFKAFLDHAIALGAKHIATGHYARVRESGGRFELLKAADSVKDQSYFLHRLTQAQLARVVFPVGELRKTEVRRIAGEAGLHNSAKRGSTGICFIGERPFREFLNRYLPRKPGPMRTPEGRTVGQHIGLSFYTIGQRKGVGIGGLKDSAGEPWYVEDLAWVSGAAPQARSSYGAKTRYRQADAACRIDRIGDEGLEVEFSAPQWAVTPGQSVVLYRDETCLGGGVIQ